MGSWTEFDATYPPGVLTPASALLVALGHLAGASSIYANGQSGALADFLPRRGIAYEPDLLGRIEHYLKHVEVDTFAQEATQRLNRRQKLSLLLNMCHRRMAAGDERPETHPLIARMISALEIPLEELMPLRQSLSLLHDLSIFPQ
ncbi:hypothetical protein [Candidatus Oscillochloris fontis]|uniref:hypothetical protein n=1 Tax=Candidatus Oscillochloris fontis TaxID=2496868 RepID=UPI00101CF96E|nr:hypothetical protein [Candidatus Oscillochloris fontis]